MLSVRPWLATLVAWRRPLAAYGISSVVHAATLFALGMFIMHAEHQASAVPSLDAEFHVSPEESQAYLSAQASTATVDVVHSAGLMHGTGGGGGVGARMGVPLAIGIALRDVGSRSGTFGLAGATAAQLRELSTDQGPSASFFGTTASGHSFVFVLDISGSMNEGGRFRRAKYELKKSLDNLSTAQQFDIIFFNGDAIPLPGPGLINSTAKNTHDAMRWVNSIHPDGDTYPMTALTMALRLDPDAIFLLSDGQFDPEVVYVISQMRTGNPIPIHTIALVSRIGEPVMKALSKVTGGSFRFVH